MVKWRNAELSRLLSSCTSMWTASGRRQKQKQKRYEVPLWLFSSPSKLRYGWYGYWSLYTFWVEQISFLLFLPDEFCCREAWKIPIILILYPCQKDVHAGLVYTAFCLWFESYLLHQESFITFFSFKKAVRWCGEQGILFMALYKWSQWSLLSKMINCCFWWQDGSSMDETLPVILCYDWLYENLLFFFLFFFWHVLLMINSFIPFVYWRFMLM